jgi:multidrug efflux pump subunit AcrB
MKGVIAWFAANGVAANILMVFIIILGLLTLGSIKQEVFPEVTPDAITILVPYPGAAPAEVEEAVVIRIEERIQDLDDIKKISSVSAENVGTVIIELEDGSDVSETLNEVKARVDAIDTFPDEAEQPVIEEFIVRRQVINVAIAGDADERTLKRIGERVRDDLAARPQISQVELVSARPYRAPLLVRSPGRLDRDGGRRDPAAHRRPGVQRPPVRGASLAGPGRWYPADSG